MDDGTNQVDMFANLVRAGVEAWTEAGRILVEAIDADPDFSRKVRKAHPEISPDMLILFERIGRRQVYPAIVLDNSVGAQALLALPYDDQERLYRGNIEVAVGTTGSRVVVKRIGDLTRTDVHRVFDGDHVRTHEEQRTYLRMGQSQRMTSGVTRSFGAPSLISAPVISAPISLSPSKIERRGCYRIIVKGSEISLVPVQESWRAQQVKLSKEVDGTLSTEVLLYLNT